MLKSLLHSTLHSTLCFPRKAAHPVSQKLTSVQPSNIQNKENNCKTFALLYFWSGKIKFEKFMHPNFQGRPAGPKVVVGVDYHCQKLSGQYSSRSNLFLQFARWQSNSRHWTDFYSRMSHWSRSMDFYSQMSHLWHSKGFCWNIFFHFPLILCR